MAGTWRTDQIAQAANSTASYTIYASPRYMLVTAGTEGNSAVAVTRHSALPDGNHRVVVEVVGGAPTILRIAGYDLF